MNLKQLEAFVKVAETKSFSETAKQLFLTQPTVSVHVSSLEQELNPDEDPHGPEPARHRRKHTSSQPLSRES